MSQRPLTPEQEVEAQDLKVKVLAAVMNDVDQMPPDGFQGRPRTGQTEYEKRDLSHQIAATTMEAAANQRFKKGLPR